ncbi:Tyrosine kinase [Entamoeba marina]
MLTEVVGTPTYLAPEALDNKPYSYPIDVYAYGLVLYETFLEGEAFDPEDPQFAEPWKIPPFVLEGNRPDRVEDMPDALWDLIDECWKQDMNSRPSFQDIVDTLESWDVGYSRVPQLKF